MAAAQATTPNAVPARTETKPPDVRNTPPTGGRGRGEILRGVPKDCRGNPPRGSAPREMTTPRRPLPPARPPRPPRRITIRRGEPGKRIGIALLAVAVVLTLFAGRLVQIQGMEAGDYRQVAKRADVRGDPAARDARHHLRRGRADPGHDRGDLHGDGGPAADSRQAARRPAARRPARPDRSSRCCNLLEHPTSKDYVVLAKGVSAPNQTKIAALNIVGVAYVADVRQGLPGRRRHRERRRLHEREPGHRRDRRAGRHRAGVQQAAVRHARQRAGGDRRRRRSRSRWPAARTPRRRTARASG